MTKIKIYKCNECRKEIKGTIYKVSMREDTGDRIYHHYNNHYCGGCLGECIEELFTEDENNIITIIKKKY